MLCVCLCFVIFKKKTTKKKTYHSHMNIRLLVLKTFQTMYCNDKISLSHNSPWPGCIICDYSRIVGQWVKQWWSWWATFHFWKKKRSLYFLPGKRDGWLRCSFVLEKKHFVSISSYLMLTHEVARERLLLQGYFFFTLCLCIFLLSIQYYHENNTK